MFVNKIFVKVRIQGDLTPWECMPAHFHHKFMGPGMSTEAFARFIDHCIILTPAPIAELRWSIDGSFQGFYITKDLCRQSLIDAELEELTRWVKGFDQVVAGIMAPAAILDFLLASMARQACDAAHKIAMLPPGAMHDPKVAARLMAARLMYAYYAELGFVL